MSCLPIAPYWNWNIGNTFYEVVQNWLPIAPYWNWNSVEPLLGLGGGSPNRTILELKLRNHTPWTGLLRYLPIAPYWNWNRLIDEISNAGIMLPIAPYWNWNEKANSLLPGFFSPNRTILELKLEELRRATRLQRSPNRTILELKQNSGRWRRASEERSQSHHTGIETISTSLL